jgi:phosphate transport system substrate-binding protein
MPRNVTRWSTTACLLGTLLIAANSASAQVTLDQSLPAYRPINALTGELTIVGSDAMTQLADVWAERFKQFYPDVQIKILSASSTRSLLAVQQGQAQIGLMSREVLPEEIDAFQQAAGHEPTILVSSYERIAVLVNNQNPIQGLTLADLDALYSATRKRGRAAIGAWGDLGVGGALARTPVNVLVRDETTGPPALVKALVLQGEDYRADAARHDSYLSLVKAVAADPSAIGFAGTTYLLKGVRPVPIAIEADQPFVAVDSEAADLGQYPLVRPQHLVVSYRGPETQTEIQREFLKYIFSDMGQEDVVTAGFQPIPGNPAKVARQAVGLDSLN